MGLFSRKSRGSITVFVVLILVPTIFFTGFLVDLARLKLYGNQALMTADNYGEAVLTEYDNLLKELYGLFAITQDAEALAGLEEIQGYMTSSFFPSENTITWQHLQSVLGTTSYEGFMPYGAANVSVNYELVENANLRNPEVFSTQIGDFMKFRIVQQLAADGSDLLDNLSKVQNIENDSKVIQKKLDIDEEAEKLYEAAREYYLILEIFTKYPEYIQGINNRYKEAVAIFIALEESESYETYRNYETANREAMTAAVEKRDENAGADQPEELTEEENKLVEIYDAYMEDENAHKEAIDWALNLASWNISNKLEQEPICFDTFDSRLDDLKEKVEKILESGKRIQNLKSQLQEMLQEENVSEELRTGIYQELERMEALFAQLEDYTRIVDFIAEHGTKRNAAYRQQTQDIIDRLEEIRQALLDCEENTPESEFPLDEGKWQDFRTVENYKKLYEELEECFGGSGDDSEGMKKKSEASSMLDESTKALDEEEQETEGYIPRDIPKEFGYGKTYSDSGFNLKKMVKEAVGYFSMNNFKESANRLVLKLYMVEYDFGMFSNRTTDIKKEKGEKEVSLTGYEKNSDLNYLYRAELEYILGGSNSYQENWKAARNKILALRAVANYTATYSIKDVNRTIQSISNAAMAVNPILALAVNGTLRTAVAGAETAADWKRLKEGEGTVLLKTEIEQLEAYGRICTLLGLEQKKEEDHSARMDYDQYLLLMLVFLTSFDEIAQRTADLIELNVNAAMQAGGENLTELRFRMGNAYTAVNAECSVQLDFAVIPGRFAEWMTSRDTYGSLEEFEKNQYKFRVTRGY